MNSLHSGLQNKDTYYLNQFYLRISYSDKSYKKHPNTKLQQTAFLWVSYRQWDFHPEEAHWAHQWSLLQELLQSTPQAQCSQHKPQHLQVTLPHLQVINRKKTTHHTAFTAVDIREKKYKYSFHRTHSTSSLTRYRTLLRVFHMWMSFECNKHSYFICYHCSPHTLSPKPQDGETSRKENKLPPNAPPGLCMRSLLYLAHTSPFMPRHHHQSHTRFQKFRQPSGSISQPCVHSVDTTPWNKE